MSVCPCCAGLLIRHVRAHHVYWFCTSCWQEMPLIAKDLSLQSAHKD